MNNGPHVKLGNSKKDSQYPPVLLFHTNFFDYNHAALLLPQNTVEVKGKVSPGCSIMHLNTADLATSP
jgi:hypothetical protein